MSHSFQSQYNLHLFCGWTHAHNFISFFLSEVRKVIFVRVKGMLDDCWSWPILSANKIGQQKFVDRHAKTDWYWLIKSSYFIVSHRTRSILDDKIGQFFLISVTMVIVYGGRWVSVIFFLLLSDVYFRSLDAEKIMQVSFCDLHSAVVYSWCCWYRTKLQTIKSAACHGSAICSGN